MPFELEPDEELVDVAPPEELEDWLDWLLDDEPELEELDPQPATPRATSTSSPAARRRGDLISVAFIIAPCSEPVETPAYDVDAVGSTLVPGR